MKQKTKSSWYTSTCFYFLLLTTTIFSNFANAAFRANFTADKTTVEVGEKVKFTDTSTGYRDWWEWEFQGGTPSYSERRNPTVTYNTPGTYDVTLTVWNGYRRYRTKTIRNYITVTEAGGGEPTSIRVPAEWEPQEAIWLQWPGRWEKVYEPAFAKMVNVIVQYQRLHILYNNNTIRNEARTAILAAGGDPNHYNITWHSIGNDNAWMRDNGPVYVVQDGEMRIQNWEFDAWGGGFGNNVTYTKDNQVPIAVGAYLNMPVDKVDVVHERGNLEFNGKDTVILNWSTIGDPNRNPGYTKAKAIADMKKHFGVSKVVMIEGVHEGDLTKGHIDGIARFINENTVVVPQCTQNSICKPGDGKDDKVNEDAAATIAAAGLNVIRMPVEGSVTFEGTTFDAEYMNWIVGNGFVIAVGFDNPTLDNAAKARLESYFPDREVHIIEMLASWKAGGGAHCHTNDQPSSLITQ
ncbi:agmatine deiminase family protein [Aliikangiella coralliicola]|uniref:PKD domain-containing protein n=1 Tax=Aliikangiella coralliicola TaxID=2592383 RepID=A0A545UE92_9GAMM|nr:agmatine deiminase family protein [Aliikangiella coralliicola]TQV87807.1 PKD domain-containing protein [Aliikangiella coralliicola]